MENEKRLDLIDRGALRKTTIELDDDCDIVDMARALVKCVREAPTVDAVQVVRCKNCKHHDEFKGEIVCDHPQWQDAEGWYIFVDADGFCYRGERSNID